MATMTSRNAPKLNHLLSLWPRGTLAVQEWFDSHGIYPQLTHRYCQGKRLLRFGRGAYQMIDDPVEWTGAVYTLQNQMHHRVHVGAQTALALQGYNHFLPSDEQHEIWLFRSRNEGRLLPKWFSNYFGQENKIFNVQRDCLVQTPELGLHDYSVKEFQIKISTPERAVLECLELSPEFFSLENAKKLMGKMSTLRPALVQQLLEACHSIKANRLFMLLAEHWQHPWMEHINGDQINFGRGKRVLAKGGRLYAKYQLSLPIHLDERAPITTMGNL